MIEDSKERCRLSLQGDKVQLAYEDRTEHFQRVFRFQDYQRAMKHFPETGQAEIPTNNGVLTLVRRGSKISLGILEGYNGMNLIIDDSGLSSQGLVSLAA